MLQILRKQKPPEADEADYDNFLQCLPDLVKISNRIDDLTAELQTLWPIYRKPIDIDGLDPGLAGLFELFLPKFFEVRKDFTENYIKMKHHLESV